MNVRERFESHVAPEALTGCHLWTASGLRGYGQFGVGGKRKIAHRFAYELYVGPIPEGKVVDHKCKNPSCVNPDHLEPVSQGENVRRGNSPSTVAAREGVCHRGHSEFKTRKSGKRYCGVCNRERKRVKGPT